ncbi:CDP-diacylglycerol--glycerol-3-phosphate 3-phosphatidyltransferase [Pontivivens insulae]|uniref:CDP-diacylglycerol--glycerol-3-phosphate 3-phosphatidyltransferase n=1 Tax=Pontivivens insulae TaxID=1639689 RepID=A0A2R8A710_9RHOB|nr:CDP-diacylglycerol--glycerol-3-phosphate 3-phosphatidyltransferase [Pontivivens insulae]RED17908.1 CDP-diacylglycerol--glycerol-3-phosphate 3-phosphatidyltransferase [Pontivivens insulae]SPF27798.1 CDP-diacylglycerol--glycerol-3-phosphate 3-phosphatidyltransferase [Pontivivens insulae]
MQWTIPNILTVLRVLAAPAIALIFLVFERPLADWVALVLFVGAALTDYVDGWIARAWDQGSAFGKMLDPIADKAMVIIALSALFALRGLDWTFVIPTTIILLREVLVSGLREFLGNVKLDVTQIAKWKTTVQMFAIAVLLGAGALGSTLFDGLGLLLLWIAALLTLLSGLDYFRKALPHLEGR